MGVSCADLERAVELYCFGTMEGRTLELSDEASLRKDAP